MAKKTSRYPLKLGVKLFFLAALLCLIYGAVTSGSGFAGPVPGPVIAVMAFLVLGPIAFTAGIVIGIVVLIVNRLTNEI
jgi:hypothetical protein